MKENNAEWKNKGRREDGRKKERGKEDK